MVMQGRELGQFVNDFIWYLRNLMLIKTSDNASEVIDASAERIKSLKEELPNLNIKRIGNFVYPFNFTQ